MPGFTAEAIPEIGAVRLVLDISDYVPDVPEFPDPAEYCVMYRLTVPPDDPDWFTNLTRVRVRPTYLLGGDVSGPYGFPYDMINGVAVWYDTEAPLDTPVWYLCETYGGDYSYVRASAIVELIGNGEFATGVAGWQADPGAAIAWETGAPLFGAGSLRITATGAPGLVGARTQFSLPAVAGRMYGFSAWMRGTPGGPWRYGVDWLNGAFGYLSTSYGPQTAVEAGVMTRRSFTAVAPPGTAYAQPRFSEAPAVAGNVLVVDRVRMAAMGAGGDQAEPGTPVVLASADGGWLSDPTTPALDVRLSLLPVDGCDVDAITDGTASGVIFAAHSAETRQSSGARFDVEDSPYPFAVNGRRKAPTASLTLAAVSFADRDRVHDLLASGRYSMLRVPAEFGISARYIDVGEVATTPLSPDLRVPYRVIDVPYAQGSTPAGPADGVTGTRFGDLDRYPTWDAFDDAGLTSVDLLFGAGSTRAIVP